ncbi:MAG TPA: hypothetical protein VED87_12485 [Methylocystis sp.]|nr:hypothetical protein [Methylocystis sp.]
MRLRPVFRSLRRGNPRGLTSAAVSIAAAVCLSFSALAAGVQTQEDGGYAAEDAPYPQAQAPQYVPRDGEQIAPLTSYVCLLHYRLGSCAITGPIGIVSGAACHCRFAGRVQYGPISLAPPHLYTCLVVVSRDSCQVPGPSGVASGADCFCELPGEVE